MCNLVFCGTYSFYKYIWMSIKSDSLVVWDNSTVATVCERAYMQESSGGKHLVT
jgi:hypothetical protein